MEWLMKKKNDKHDNWLKKRKCSLKKQMEEN